MFAQLCSPTAWANARNGSPMISGSCFLVRAMPFAPMACPTRCRSAPSVVLRAVPWRRILSYASLPCRRNGLRAWRPARLLLGDVWLSSSSCFCYVLSHRPGRFWCVCPWFYVGDSVAPVLSRRRILWVEAFAQGCSDGICANTQGHITRCKERTLIPALQTFDSSTSNNRDLRRGEW